MILRDCIVRSGIVDSKRVCALPLPCQLFFRNLLHACDGAGRFPADADELRNAFYWRSPGVSIPHVEAWLTKCHQARLVKLYTSGGRAFGEMLNYGQRDTKRRVLYPGPDDGELNFAVALEAEDDPPESPPLPKKKGSKVKGREGAREALENPSSPVSDLATAAPSADDSNEAWVARLQAAWPHLDIQAELANAWLKKTKQGGKLERGWFEKSWLANASQVVTRKDVFAPKKPEPGALVIPPEGPEDWKRAVEGTPLGEAVWADGLQWGDLNKGQQAFVLERLGERRVVA